MNQPKENQRVYRDNYEPNPNTSTPGEVRKGDMGTEVPLKDLASDRPSYTGPTEGMGNNAGKID